MVKAHTSATTVVFTLDNGLLGSPKASASCSCLMGFYMKENSVLVFVKVILSLRVTQKINRGHNRRGSCNVLPHEIMHLPTFFVLQPLGFGVMEHPSGHTYEGQWRANKMCGWGTYDYGNGVMYKGAASCPN